MRFLWPTRFIIFGFFVLVLSPFTVMRFHTFHDYYFEFLPQQILLFRRMVVFFVCVLFRIYFGNGQNRFRVEYLLLAIQLLPLFAALCNRLAIVVGPKWHFSPFIPNPSHTISNKTEWSKSKLNRPQHRHYQHYAVNKLKSNWIDSGFMVGQTCTWNSL